MASTYNGSVANLVDPLTTSPLNSPSHAGQHTEINDALQTLGVWTSFTPTWTGLTVGNGTNVGVYTIFNKTMFVKTRFTMGSTSVMGSFPTMTLPASAQASLTNQLQVGLSMQEDSGSATYSGTNYLVTSTTIRPYVLNTGFSYAVLASLSATIPMTWVTGDILALDFCVELA